MHAEIGVAVGVLFSQACADCIHVRLRLRYGEAGFQTRDAAEEIIPALRRHRLRSIAAFAQNRDRDPKIGWDVVATEREIETLRHHPDDLVTVAVQGNGPADNGLITAELRLPHCVAQDDIAIPGLIFVRGKGPAEQRFGSK